MKIAIKDLVKKGEVKNVNKEIESIMEGIVGDLRNVAKDYGAMFLIVAVVIYLWRKLK